MRAEPRRVATGLRKQDGENEVRQARSLSNSPPFSVRRIRRTRTRVQSTRRTRTHVLMPSALDGSATGGYSSVARAVALQAIGLGFKSPYLQ